MQLGGRYATVLGVVPDLLAGTCDEQELVSADEQVLKVLRRFSPSIRRRSQHLQNGLYLLDASGLERAFRGMKSWARALLTALRRAGWEGRLAVGFTPFATEMATYHLTKERPIRLFQNRRQEERKTLETPLTAFSLSPEQISKLRRFQIFTLGDFLALESEEVKRRFGGDLLEFYDKAAGAIFCCFPPLPEPEPLMAQFGFAQPVSQLPPLLESTRKLLSDLVPGLLKQEEAVACVQLQFLTEDNRCHTQVLRPTYPTADVDWLMQLIKLRLEQHFQRYPLRWGSRIERLVVEVLGEIDPEKQGDLFTDWALDVSGDGDDVTLAPRDKQAGLWALSQVRAEFGEHSLVRAHLLDHHLPDRDHAWRAEKEEMNWLNHWGARKKRELKTTSQKDLDLRIRRVLYQPIGLSRRNNWSAEYGPYSINGGWWSEPYSRDYFFCQRKKQTAWIYEDHQTQRFRVQGWLQ